MNNKFKATAPIKLVIWDMDDTFWKGTLSEGDITIINKNIEIVKTLTGRGIMSSIASKNDFEPVKNALIKAGVWDYFIFPHILWSAKGESIRNIIEQASLRPDNILFIDDNVHNLEEVSFCFPKMMVSHPDNILSDLLELEQAKGKEDKNHSRLNQYKQLEMKVSDKAQTTLNNEDFLRQCGTVVRREFDVDAHFDRIVELINRSNQLNYTKIRLESSDEIAEFRKNLNRHDVFASAIFVSDRYGDHGLVGFYMQLKNESINKLIHYVWSCRLVNTGLEQYIYESLGEPTIKIIEPVSNPIKTFKNIDWINEAKDNVNQVNTIANHRLLLIGSCDLTAVASYCCNNRVEYVNGIKNGVMTRYDDFGFILNDAQTVKKSKILDKIPAWDKQNFISFHNDLASSDVLIVSLSAAMKGDHLLTDEGVVIRINPGGLGDYIDMNPFSAFIKQTKFYSLSVKQKGELLRMSLNYLNEKSQQATNKFLLEAYIPNVQDAISSENYELLMLHNSICEEFCKKTSGWELVPINKIVTNDKVIDECHYSRGAYLEIAQYINERTSVLERTIVSQPSSLTTDNDFLSLIQSGRKLGRFSLVGSKRGFFQHIKRVIKLTPFYGILLKTILKRSKDPLLD